MQVHVVAGAEGDTLVGCFETRPARINKEMEQRYRKRIDPAGECCDFAIVVAVAAAKHGGNTFETVIN